MTLKTNHLKYTWILLLYSLLLSHGLFGQSDVVALDEAGFQEKIATSAWTVTDTTLIEEHEMFIALVGQDSISFAYINWLDAFYSGRSTYELNVENSFFELSLDEETNELQEANFIYGYLESPNKLFVLISEKALKLTTAIRDEEGWINLERVSE